MKKAKTLLNIFCIIIAIYIVIATVADFSFQLQNILKEKTYQTLSEVSKHYNKSFSDNINRNIQILNTVSKNIAAIPSPTKETIIAILQGAVDSAEFRRVTVSDTTGIGCANDGTISNVAFRDYFKRAVKGETVVSPPLESVIDGEKILVIIVPIVQDGNILGVLRGIYPLDLANKVFLDSNYYSDGYGFILSPNGDVILSDQNKIKLYNGNNMFDFFKTVNFDNFSLTELKTAMRNKETGTFSFNYNGSNRFVNFTPSAINDWYTFSVTSDKFMIQEKASTNHLVIQIIIKIFAAILIIITLVVIGKHRHTKELSVANDKYHTLLSNINGGMMISTYYDNINLVKPTYISSVFTEITGYTLDDINTTCIEGCKNFIYEDDIKKVFSQYKAQIAKGKRYHLTYRIMKKDKTLIWVMDNGYMLKTKYGVSTNYSIISDITVLKQQEEDLRVNDERFRIAIKASNGTIFEVDLQNNKYTHFENSEQIFGATSEKLLADTEAFSSLDSAEYANAVAAYFSHPDDAAVISLAFEKINKGQTASYEARMRRADNTYIWCKIDLGVILSKEGIPMRLVGYVTDISESKKQTELLKNQVQIDPLTGLYNKSATVILTNKILETHSNELHALIVLDVDNFKGVNDLLGHAFGDAVLMDVAIKLKSVFRKYDIVGRIGGDEFAILMRNIPNIDNVLKKAAEISNIFRQTYIGKNKNYKISCSMGIVMFENETDRFENLFPKADAALYKAKANGKDTFAIYDISKVNEYSISTAKITDAEMGTSKTHKNIDEQIFELLYESKDFSVSINMALATIGQQYHVSRMYIFENNENNTTTSNTYEWCENNTTSQRQILQDIPIVLDGDSYLSCFDSNGLFYCNDTSTISSPYVRQILEPQGILSSLQMAIMNDGQVCGFIGFDDCTTHRIWTAEEIDTLSFLAKILGIFVLKKKAESALVSNLADRIKILDNLPDYICVVNPKTHSIEYANSKMTEIIPTAKNGAYCYSVLYSGQTEPCKSCIMEKLKNGNTNDMDIINEDMNVKLKAKAVYIEWSDQKKMVLIHGTKE